MIWFEHCGQRMEQVFDAFMWRCEDCGGVVFARDAHFKWRGLRP